MYLFSNISSTTAVATSVENEEKQEGNNTFWIHNQKKTRTKKNDEKFIRDKKR